MKKIAVPIAFTTVVWLFYQASPFFDATMMWMTIMQVFLVVLMIWMVVRILKDGEPSSKTFEEHFYDDHDYRRNS